MSLENRLKKKTDFKNTQIFNVMKFFQFKIEIINLGPYSHLRKGNKIYLSSKLVCKQVNVLHFIIPWLFFKYF